MLISVGIALCGTPSPLSSASSVCAAQTSTDSVYLPVFKLFSSMRSAVAERHPLKPMILTSTFPVSLSKSNCSRLIDYAYVHLHFETFMSASLSTPAALSA